MQQSCTIGAGSQEEWRRSEKESTFWNIQRKQSTIWATISPWEPGGAKLKYLNDSRLFKSWPTHQVAAVLRRYQHKVKDNRCHEARAWSCHLQQVAPSRISKSRNRHITARTCANGIRVGATDQRIWTGEPNAPRSWSTNRSAATGFRWSIK